MKPILSICLAVYNQYDLVKWNLDNIVRNKRKDIEIIIQDDNSSDNISGLVSSYKDSRIKYFKNINNIGHDKNILEALKNCKSKYAFVLRSSDTLLKDGIDSIISIININPHVGYYRFSCIDENKRFRIKYKDRLYRRGRESISINNTLLIHPSGELYNLNYLKKTDINTLEHYLSDFFIDNYKFVVHIMIRHLLVLRADVYTSSKVCWVYTKTENRKDKAQNSTKNRVCVYSPDYQYRRYLCELSFAMDELKTVYKEKIVKGIINRYAKMIIFEFYFINKNLSLSNHYQFDKINYSMLREFRIFKNKTLDYAYSFDNNDFIISAVKTLGFHCLIKWYIENAIKGIRYRITRLEKYNESVDHL